MARQPLTSRHPEPRPAAGGGRWHPAVSRGRVLALALTALVMIGLGISPAVRRAFTPERIEALSLAWGWRAPFFLFLLGVLLPLLLIPRWPLCAVSGLLFGILEGALLCVAAATVSAWLGVGIARAGLGSWPRRLLRRLRLDTLRATPAEMFRFCLWIRAIPFSSFTAVNLLGASLRIPMRVFLTATFLGLIPSSLCYAAWGRLPELQARATLPVAAASALFLLASVALARYRLVPWLERHRAEPDPAGQEG